jgi:hypothetical protein
VNYPSSTQQVEAVNLQISAFACQPGCARSDGFVVSIANDDVEPVTCRRNKLDFVADVTARHWKIDDFSRAERRGPTPTNQNPRSDDYNTHNLPP